MLDVEELAKKELILLAVEAFMDQKAKGFLIDSLETTLDGLQLASSSLNKVNSGNLHPEIGLSRVHLKIGLSMRHRQLGLFTIELGKVHVQKLAKVGSCGCLGEIELVVARWGWVWWFGIELNWKEIRKKNFGCTIGRELWS